MTRGEFQDIVREAVAARGGAAAIVEFARYIWDEHEADPTASGELFYTWQHDTRWAAQRLRDARKLSHEKRSGKDVWRNL